MPFLIGENGPEALFITNGTIDIGTVSLTSIETAVEQWDRLMESLPPVPADLSFTRLCAKEFPCDPDFHQRESAVIAARLRLQGAVPALPESRG